MINDIDTYKKLYFWKTTSIVLFVMLILVVGFLIYSVMAYDVDLDKETACLDYCSEFDEVYFYNYEYGGFCECLDSAGSVLLQKVI